MPDYTKIDLYNGEVEILFNEEAHRYYRLDYDNLTKKGEPKKKSICGVTTFLSIIDKSRALIPWAVNLDFNWLNNELDKLETPHYDGFQTRALIEEARVQHNIKKEEAADLGKDIHAWIEDHIKGNQPEIPEDENIKRGVISFLAWESENKPEYLESEKIVYSRKYDYVGTLDVIAKIDGKLFLIDLKTGNAIYQEAHAQTAAYMKADMEERGTKYEGRIILRISKETEAEYVERVKEKAWFKKDETKYPYQVFEAIYLDKDGSSVHQDFEAFVHALGIYRWKR